jgi:adenine-specific DNA-methyltransferase
MTESKVQRLNYIGSKYKLLDWIFEHIENKTGYELEGKYIADLFAGTGIVSHYLRNLGCIVISNDAELYSYIITSALSQSTYSQKLQDIIDDFNSCERSEQKKVGYITENYSPCNTNERKFFTLENAMRIDYIRSAIEDMIDSLTEQEYIFLLASLIVSADNVSNVPAVYGCYLKNFKDKAKKPMVLIPIHTNTEIANANSVTYNKNIVDLIDELSDIDIVYLDPPYNERQYSKNYFPLNMIAKNPEILKNEPELKGVTGIPTDCFISPFCKKSNVENAFRELFLKLQGKTKWIFMSYNNESLLTKDKLIELMSVYGKCTVVEQDYKRFKSFKYNKDKPIQEYLFCLKMDNFEM